MDLVPGKTYLIKYILPNNKGHFVFECEFIKYVDQTIKNDVIRFKELQYLDEDEDDIDVNDAHELFERYIYLDPLSPESREIAFDDARYPYTPSSTYQFPLSRDKDLNIGLFKYIRLVHTTINDQIYNKKFRETLCKNRFIDDLYILDHYDVPFVRGYKDNVLRTDQDRIHKEFIPNETLMWVALDEPNIIKIIKGNIQQGIIEEKTLTNLEKKTGFKPHVTNVRAKPLPQLPYDVTRQIAEFVDSEEYLNKTRRGGKSKQRKNKKTRRKTKKL